MANQSVIVNDQVDLNNNNDEKATTNRNVNGGEQQLNGDHKATETNKTNETNKIEKSSDESEDLVLKLRRIILQQEREEKELLQRKLEEQKEQNGGREEKQNTTTVSNKIEEPSSKLELVNGQIKKSPKLEKKSICQINKSPTPSRKMINQTKSETIEKTINTQTSQPLIKDTFKKLSDKAVEKINQNGKLTNGQQNGHATNGSPLAHVNGTSNVNVTIPLNGDRSGSSISNSISEGSISDYSISNESINNSVRHIVSQANELKKQLINNGNSEIKIESKRTVTNKMENGSNRLETDKLVSNDKSEMTIKTEYIQHESITIIQTKPISNRSKIDPNNNLPEQLNNLIKANNNSTAHHHEETTKIDKQTDEQIDKHEDAAAAATTNKQTNGGDTKPVKQEKEEANKKEMPEIELIIRASNIDGKRKGADLFCQEYFMDLFLLAELNYIHMKISTVDLNKLSPSFRSKFDCTKPPILLVKSGNEQRAVLENEKIERYIMKNIPGGHLLFVKDLETAKLIENLYSKFKLALSRNEPHTKQALLKHLDAIDRHLGERKTKFITGDHLCCFNFELITKLQHIRVAGEYFIDQFEIPSHLANLWKYMNTMYHLRAFIEAAPDDQTIISHYLNSNSILVNRSPAKNKQQTLQKPSISISTP